MSAPTAFKSAGAGNRLLVFLHGIEGNLENRETMARMAERIPGARHECLDGLGHLAHLEAPDHFKAALEAFLRSLGAVEEACTRP